MKNLRNGFIKNLHYLCVIGAVALGLMTIVATGGGGGGSGDAGGTGGTVDVTGYWNVYHTTEGESGEKGPDNWIITQSDSNITIDSCGEDSGSATGTINDSSISISWTDGVTVSLTGTVSGDTIEGTWTETTGISGTWRAEKTESHDVNIQTTSSMTHKFWLQDWQYKLTQSRA